MNRIQTFSPVPDFEANSPADSSQVGAAVFSSAVGETPCAFFAPLHYEPNYAYPLLVWLHGSGEDENRLKRIMPLVSMRNYVGVSLRGTVACPSNRGKPAFSWSQTRAHVSLAEQRLFDALELAEARFNVSPRRVFLAGFDCGGTMAFRLAMSHPNRVAGVLSIHGEFPDRRTPLVRLTDARRVPIFLACGRDSQSYPTASVCENLKLFHSAGMQIALRQYPCGHELSPDMLSDMDRWIMEQINSTPASAG